MEDDHTYFPQLTPGLPRASAVVPDVRLVRKIDRRDVSARAALVARVDGEFHEIPGLSVSLAQAQRLFGLREDICVRILDGLVLDGTLGRTSAGLYYRTRAMA